LHLSAHLPHYYRIIYSVTMWLFSLKTTTFAVSLINDEQNPFINAPIKPRIPKCRLEITRIFSGLALFSHFYWALLA
ncbi:MAG: hypothetical protein ACRDAL_04975, partial [Plesiomonas shigelloides]